MPATVQSGSEQRLVEPLKYQWLTTAPNPRHPGTGYDAGQRGWRTHAVPAAIGDRLSDTKYRRALCGLRPAHGWGMDLFIEERCARCDDAMDRLKRRR